ncbi:leucine-rich repeat, cysteine-containing subtype protein [Tanacetum coccineum]
MAPTKVGEEVLDLVISYIHNVEDRNSLSLVSRKFYELDGITRKCLTVHTLYYPNPSRLSKRFPFMETLTLKGPPCGMRHPYHNDIRITPWTEQLALEFRYLKELHIRHLVVPDEDLETLARTRGRDLRSLKISKCIGFSTDGLRHVSKYCNQLRTLCLGYSYNIEVNDGIWLHELALNSTIGRCYLSKLGDAFRYAVRLEHFGGDIWDEENDLIRKLKFGYSSWLWIQRCQILEVLYIEDECGDKRLQVIGKFCKKLRKLTLTKHVTNVGRISLAKECTKLESLKIRLRDISYEALECLGTHLKNLCKYCINLDKIDGTTDLPLDIGIRALLMGCNKLESLYISLRK